MKRNWLLIGSIAVLVIAAVLIVNSANQKPAPRPISNTTSTQPQHQHSANAATIPAHFEVAPSRSSLGPTLDPGQFSGITRDAYRAVREIPVTVAQLPCYCHCDQGFGHKSLYSCFEDDHASHCDVCVREALLALRLEKEQKMSPAQIRDTIVAQYSR
jgi:Protein of unknown function with PCYCGC motif